MSLFRRREQRSLSYQDVFGSGGPLLGSSADSALRLVPLFGAQRLIAEQFASTPIHAYQENGDGSRERLLTQPPLIVKASPTRAQYTWKFQCISSLLSYGNAYGFITARDALTRPTAIEWLPPTQVHVDESDPFSPAYFWQGRRVPNEDIVHIPWFVLPGQWVGLSPVGAFKVAFETGQAALQTSHDWFKNGAIPSAHFKNTAKTLTEDQSKNVKSKYKAAVEGRDVLVTGSDWELKTIGVPADEARFIEQAKLTATQIAAIYGIPPEEIGGERGSSMTYSTVEMDDIKLSSRTMRPWFTRVEDHLTELLPRPQYAKFNVDATLRTDLKTRMESHEIGLRTGILTNDEARRIEDRKPLTEDQKAEWLATWKNPLAPQAPTGEVKQ